MRVMLVIQHLVLVELYEKLEVGGRLWAAILRWRRCHSCLESLTAAVTIFNIAQDQDRFNF